MNLLICATASDGLVSSKSIHTGCATRCEQDVQIKQICDQRLHKMIHINNKYLMVHTKN